MSTGYFETRRHELRKTRVAMVDGSLTANLSTVQSGVSARSYREGYWGLAAAPQDEPPTVSSRRGSFGRSCRGSSGPVERRLCGDEIGAADVALGSIAGPDERPLTGIRFMWLWRSETAGK